MVILLAKGSTQKPPRNILLRAVAYDTVPKQTILPLQNIKKEFMMIIIRKKVKMENADTTTRRNPDSTSGIYLTAVKVEQCRYVDDNRREKEEAKKATANKTATRKFHL